MKKTLLIVLAILFSLSTYANTNRTPNTEIKKKQIIDSFTEQLVKLDKENDSIKITKISMIVNKLTQSECTITAKITAKLTLFGTGVEVELGASVTAATCAEASKLAWQGVRDAATGLQNSMRWIERVVDNL